jgi:hypothetical protein
MQNKQLLAKQPDLMREKQRTQGRRKIQEQFYWREQATEGKKKPKSPRTSTQKA